MSTRYSYQVAPISTINARYVWTEFDINWNYDGGLYILKTSQIGINPVFQVVFIPTTSTEYIFPPNAGDPAN